MQQSKTTKLFVWIILVVTVAIVIASVNLRNDGNGSFLSQVISNFSIQKIFDNPPQETIRIVTEESATIDVVKNSQDSVVSVVERSVSFDLFNGPQLQESSIGTGFFVGDKIVITNKHVVSDSSATYTVVDTAGVKHTVGSIFRDPLNDLALLTVEDLSIQALGFGDSARLQVGQTVIAIGNALGRFSNTVTKGVVSGVGRGITASGGLGQFQEEIDDVIQTDAALNPGNSGGPLLNLEGQVIGVNVAISVGSENIGFAIPSNTVVQLVKDFKAGVVRQRPFLGVSYALVTAEFSKNSNLPEGAYVRQVVAGSPAEKAGIKVDDIITKIGEVSITEESSLSNVVSKHKVSDIVEIVLYRDGDFLTIQATLEAVSE